MSLLDMLKTVPRSDSRSAARSPRPRSAIARREPITEVVIPVAVGDTVRNIELSARPTFSRTGRFTGYHGVGSDVADARQAADRIAHMAATTR